MSHTRTITKRATLSVVAGVLLWGGAAVAQTANPPATPPGPASPTAPNAQPPSDLGRAVVPPPRNVDPEMVTPPPASTPNMPVIKPPAAAR